MTLEGIDKTGYASIALTRKVYEGDIEQVNELLKVLSYVYLLEMGVGHKVIDLTGFVLTMKGALT